MTTETNFDVLLKRLLELSKSSFKVEPMKLIPINWSKLKVKLA